MINNLIVFLIRLKLHVKNNQLFRFTNQRDPAFYMFIPGGLLKVYKIDDRYVPDVAGVSLDWLLNEDCEVITYES